MEQIGSGPRESVTQTAMNLVTQTACVNEFMVTQGLLITAKSGRHIIDNFINVFLGTFRDT
jgi:hypothetical protein